MFGYSRQVYYRNKKVVFKNQKLSEEVVRKVQEIRNRMPRIGCRKLYFILKDDFKAMKIGRDKLFRLLKINHMLIEPLKQYHVTTFSHHRFRKHKNAIETLEINKPNQVWVTDITYIGTRKNPMYLSLITDAYSKKIMGYNVSNSLETAGSSMALKRASKHIGKEQINLIHHSDRGVQYCSDEYQKLLKKYKIKCSMTESYDPYQNAVAERINGILKQEFIMGVKLKNINLMKKLIKQSVRIYNEERPHWSSYMLTPCQMHLQKDIKMKTYKKKKSFEDVHLQRI